MFTFLTDQCRRLLLAFTALLLLAFGQQAQAQDYTAGVANINGAATLWLQGASINQSIAHYNINGGPQQNVGMSFNSTRSRYELAVPGAAAGQTINHQFTYFKNGLAYDTAWSSSVVPPGDDPGKVATPTFSLAAGTYASTQQVSVSTSTAGATLMCSINGGPSAVCANPITVAATSTITAYGSKAGLSNSNSASATYTIGGTPPGITHGVVDNTTSLTIWFSHAPKSDWVDIHYTLNGGAQQNVALGYNGTSHQVSVSVASGGAAALSYSFT